jgi:hypothetical protein
VQLEKCGGNAPFTKYYTSVIEKAGSRNLLMNGKIRCALYLALFFTLITCCTEWLVL